MDNDWLTVGNDSLFSLAENDRMGASTLLYLSGHQVLTVMVKNQKRDLCASVKQQRQC